MISELCKHTQFRFLQIWEPRSDLVTLCYNRIMKRTYRPPTFEENYATIPAFKKGKYYDVIVDTDVALDLAKSFWSVDARGYAKRSNHRHVYIHRAVMDAGPYEQVDHINGNRLDNRRCNLRIATNQQNQMARHVVVAESGYKGVHKHGAKFRAQIKFNGKLIRLGSYPTSEKAARAYNQAAIALFEEFAVINELREV